MNRLRLIIFAVAVVCVLAITVFAVVSGSQSAPADDVIIIKGGSLEITCGKNHGNDCLGTSDGHGKYKHKKSTAHIMEITVKNNANVTLFSNTFDAAHQPEIQVTYK